jgi:hypothetical protein
MIWVIQMTKLEQPILENKEYGPGGGIPLLKSLWEKFDLQLIFSQCGFQKHAGIPAWLMSFVYICGIIAKKTSVNQNAQFSSDSPILNYLLKGKTVTQSAFSRFFSAPYQWLKLSVARVSRLQETEDTKLSDGDVIALDDTKIVHPFGKKLPFLCWLFDYSNKSHVWCMNIVSTLAVLKNGLEYPLFWRFWVKQTEEDSKKSKLELSKQMLQDVRNSTTARLWVAMDRWFLCWDFFEWLQSKGFDWVTKAKKNTVLYVKSASGYKKTNPKELLATCYSKLSKLGKDAVIVIPDIYVRRPYDTLTKMGKPTRKWHYVPITAIASTYKQATEPSEGLIQEEDETATYKDAFLLISNRMDCPEEVAKVYAKRWKIEVFYRTTKQELGLTNCHSRSESAHFAHMELLFLAETLLCFSKWECNKEGANEALSHSQMVGYLFNASHRVVCNDQTIQIYYDISGAMFSRFINKFWPPQLDFFLWNWYQLPTTA